MRFDDFRQLVRRLQSEVPAEYLDGVLEVAVSPKAVPHPIRADVYTLGECIPVEWSGDGKDLQSRVVLYHGSFQALARLGGLGGPGGGDFDWREEAWETLTHELRHHLEWRASVGALEAYDWAAEQNFARHEGQAFDPDFYRSGEKVADGVWKVDDDVFLERATRNVQRGGEGLEVVWHGRRYWLSIPGDARTFGFLILHGLDEPPPGDAVLVLRRRASLFDLWRRPKVVEVAVTVEPVGG